MREILFRGKCVDTGKWYEGQYIELHKTTFCSAVSEQRERENEIHQIVFERMTDWSLPNQHFRVDVSPETVGQYTGMTDKNSKKIFEGDICKHRSNYSGEYIISVVTYTDGQFLAMAGENRGFNLSDKLEIIGNIHDNPELLKGGA